MIQVVYLQIRIQRESAVHFLGFDLGISYDVKTNGFMIILTGAFLNVNDMPI